MLKKLFVFAGWLILLCVVFLFCCTLGLWRNWSTVTIILVWLSLLVTGMVLSSALYWLTLLIKEKKVNRFFHKFRLSRREYVLFEHWKAGAGVVKRIQRQRPPIPWYLLAGDRCGKTSLLASSDLNVFSSDTQDNSVVPTHTLRWWFFRHVSILDLSGNFLNGTPTFHRAWGKLVSWIVRMPAPAGVIVCLSVGDLMNADASVLHDKARKIRAQLDPLMSKLKHQLPLYVTITQCDKFPAFSLWTKQLSVAQQQQALGYYWQTPPDIDGKDDSTLQPLFSALKKGFDLARISMTGAPVEPDDRASLLAFPESFAQLEKPLLVFLASLCEPNAYFTHTALGGVWFTSTEPQDKNKKRRNAYFVHDLLMLHLPAFSRSRDVIWQHNNRLRAISGRLLLLGCIGALGYSALRSADLMQHDTAALSPAELANLLVKNETHHDSPLIYAPFALVLNHQHQLTEQRLRTRLRSKPLDTEQMCAAYQQRFMAATAQTQRQMVLSLAQTILTRQKMRDGVTLEELVQQPAIPDDLRLNTIDASTSPQARLALERWEMQQPAGADNLEALHRLLSVLMADDRTLAWLVAPDDRLPTVQASDFWPQLPATVTLSGIWTRQGEAELTEWGNLIAAAGNKAELQQFIAALPGQRQNAWREFLLSVSPLLQNPLASSLSQSQLIALRQGQSPAMKLAQRIASDLDNIPPQSAQPWLVELQTLQKLSTQASEKLNLQKLQRVDAALRSGLTQWLQGGKSPAVTRSDEPQTVAWQNWQKSLNAATDRALNQPALSPALTEGLFTPQAEAKNVNPLITLYTSADRLRKTLESRNDEMGVEAVWSLYQNDADTLLAHALARSGCWINKQWQSKVLWPMRKNANTQNYDAQQALTWQSLADFVRGPIKGLLVINDQGPQAGEFRGQALPLTEAFVNIARHLLNPEDLLDVPLRKNTQNADQLSALSDRIEQMTQQQKALEAKAYNISIISRPATVPEGARLIPTGSRLTLECQSDVKVLDSMNFAEQAQFTWRPGQCQSVSLDVKFPDFTARYHYTGNSAWPDFLQQFIHGEALLNVRDFEDNTDVLASLDIKHVLVRFKIADQAALQNAWMAWRTLGEQITTLNEQKQALEVQQQSLEPSATLRGRLSELPENAADCR